MSKFQVIDIRCSLYTKNPPVCPCKSTYHVYVLEGEVIKKVKNLLAGFSIGPKEKAPKGYPKNFAKKLNAFNADSAIKAIHEKTVVI